MIYPKLTICIHIPNIKRVHNVNCMKASDSRVTCISISFEQELHIHEAKHAQK